MNGEHDYTVFETRNGFVALAWRESGVSALRLPSTTARDAEAAILKRLPRARPVSPPPSIAALVERIMRYFEGDRIEFDDVPVDLGEQSQFFQDTYAETRKLAWGQTTTYGAIAKALGAEPQAARDVGQAMANNPAPLIVPCHRVLAAGGKVGGFSAPGGALSKTKMLEIEGVTITPAGSRSTVRSTPNQPSFDF